MNLKELQRTIEKIGEGLPPEDDWMPVLIVESKTDSSVYMFAGDSMLNTTTKDMVAEQMTKVIAEFKPDLACFVTTAWLIEGDSWDEFEVELWKAGATKISDDPRKVEIVNVYVYAVRGPSKGEALMIGYIQRFPDKGPKIKKWKIDKGTTAEGRFPEAIRRGFEKEGG